MKKLFTQVTKKNGEVKNVYVCVDDETARVLEQVDEQTRKDYLQAEYEMTMADINYRRRNQSLEKSVDNGFDVADEEQDVEENAIKEMEREQIGQAIAQLEPQQQWLVKQLYFCGRTQVDVAAELGVTKAAITNRLKKISEKIKKFLK